MQPKTNHALLCPDGATRVGLAGITGLIVAMPKSAYALTLDEVLAEVSSPPVMCYGIGILTGTLVTGLVAHGLHQRKLRILEGKVTELEDQMAASVGGNTPKNEHALQIDEVLVEDAEDSSMPVGKHFAKPNSSNEVKVWPKHHLASVDSVFGDLLKLSDENDLPHFERGDSSGDLMRSSDDLERTHAMQVLHTLDSATRANIIKKRIPCLGKLNAMPEGRAAKDEQVVETDPARRIEQIYEEELRRRDKEAAKAFSRSHLTVVEGSNGNVPKRAKDTQNGLHGKHFAPVTKEA